MRMNGYCTTCGKTGPPVTVAGWLQPGAALAYGTCRPCERTILADRIREGLRGHGIDAADAPDSSIWDVVMTALPDFEVTA